MEETWDDYEDEGPHTHSAFETRLGLIFYHDARPDAGAGHPVYMRFRTAPVLLAATVWFIVACAVPFYGVRDGAIDAAALVIIVAAPVVLANFWWFDYVRIDETTVERSHLFGFVRHRGRIDVLRDVQSRPLRGLYGITTPSMRFVFPDQRFEVRAAAYHWVDGRKLAMRLHKRGIAIAPKLIQHFELDDPPPTAGAEDWK
ncbi:MAG: hypothetical protein WEB52_09965 [Dehalococcoidia bacterium]